MKSYTFMSKKHWMCKKIKLEVGDTFRYKDTFGKIMSIENDNAIVKIVDINKSSIGNIVFETKEGHIETVSWFDNFTSWSDNGVLKSVLLIQDAIMIKERIGTYIKINNPYLEDAFNDLK